MSIQNSIRRLRVTSVGSFPRFLIMFILIVVGPLMLLIIGGYDLSIPMLAGSAWFFLAIALVLIVSIGGGFLMSRRKSDASEKSLYQSEILLKGEETNAKTNHNGPPDGQQRGAMTSIDRERLKALARKAKALREELRERENGGRDSSPLILKSGGVV